MKSKLRTILALAFSWVMPCLMTAQSFGSGALIAPENGSLANFRLGQHITAYFSFVRPMAPMGSLIGQWPEMIGRNGRVFTTPDGQIALIVDGGGYVQEIVSSSPQTFTQRFIGPGAPVTAVLQAYGQAARVVPTSCGSALVYLPFLSPSLMPTSAGMAFRLCRGPNTVTAISIFNPNPAASW
jgi:hypothetical protein